MTAWTQEHESSFERVKHRLLEALSLKHPNYGRKFQMYSNASDTAIIAVLVQQSKKDEEILPKMACKTIAYFSRTLSRVEQRYAIPQKEVIGLVAGLEFFRSFCFNYPIESLTDQKSALWLVARDMPTKFYRYQLRISAFSPKIRNEEGNTNITD